MGGAMLLRVLWSFRFSILLLLTIAGAYLGAKYMLQLRDEAKEARAAFAEAERINSDLAKAMERLNAVRQFNEHALTLKLARKSKEADQLGRLVEHVMAQEKSNACAASPAIRSLFDSLRSPGSPEE